MFFALKAYNESGRESDMVYTIYGDLLFFTDFLMDLTLLWAVCRFGCFKTRPVFLIPYFPKG